MNNFYTDSKMYYTEVAIVLEDYKPGETKKFRIPAIMPFMNSDVIYKKTNQVNQKTKIDNYDKSILGNLKYNCCNYLELYVPNNVEEGRVGDKFLVTFVGGDINKCEIIRRC